MKLKEDKKSKHIISNNCLKTCATISLNASLCVNKSSYGMCFKGDAKIFSNIGYSPINYLLSMENNSFENGKISLSKLEEKCIEKEKELISKNIGIIEDKEKKNENQKPIKKDILLNKKRINFPIETLDITALTNKTNDYMVLEFELASNNKDLKFLRDLNSNFVDNEMYFEIQGTVHGQNLFANKLKFSVETRKFIKSAQFSLENYIDNCISRNEYMVKNKVNLPTGNKTLFFTRIQSPPNMHFEFFKPFHNNIENYSTNFNSVVNSNIKVTKIFFELNVTNLSPIVDITLSSLTENTKNNLESCLEESKEMSHTTIPSKPSKVEEKLEKIEERSKSDEKYMLKTNHEEDIAAQMLLTSDLKASNYYQFYSKYNYLQRTLYTILLTRNIGLCNFYLFLRSITLNYKSSTKSNLGRFLVKDFFDSLYERSIFGLDVNYINMSEIVNVNYSPTLSALSLIIENQEASKKLFASLRKAKNLKEANKVIVVKEKVRENETEHKSTIPVDTSYESKSSDEIIDKIIQDKEQNEFYFFNDMLKFSFNDFTNQMKIEYFENKPHHLRSVLCEVVDQIFSADADGILNGISIDDINLNSSFFSICWYPLKYSNQKFFSPMLVFYQFKSENPSTYDYYLLETLEIPIIGVVPMKLDDKVWLGKINNYLNLSLNSASFYDYEFKLTLEKLIANVTLFLKSNSINRLYDYDSFMKYLYH